MSTLVPPSPEESDSRPARPELGGRGSGFVPELSAVFITTVPTLLLITFLSLSGDPALIRVIAASGNVVSLVVTLTYQILPLVVGATVTVMLMRITLLSLSRALLAGGLAAALVAFLATPIRFIAFIAVALIALTTIAFLLATLRSTSKNGHEPSGKHPERVPTRRKEIGISAVAALAPIFALLQNIFSITGISPLDMVDGATSLIAQALPAEVVTMRDETGEHQFIRSHLVQAGDQVTIIVNDRDEVQYLWNEDVLRRQACVDRLDAWNRSPLSLLTGQIPKTPSCEHVQDTLIAAGVKKG